MEIKFIEINFFEGGKNTSPSFKKYNDFWSDEEILLKYNFKQVNAIGMNGDEVRSELEKIIDASKRTFLLGGDHRFTHSLVEAYYKKIQDFQLKVYDEHLDAFVGGKTNEINYGNFLRFIPDKIRINVTPAIFRIKTDLKRNYFEYLNPETPTILSLCADYLSSNNPLGATTSWVNLRRDEDKPLFFSTFFEFKKVIAFHLAECRKDIRPQYIKGAVKEIESIIKEFIKLCNNTKTER